MSRVERLKELGIELPSPPQVMGLYKPVLEVDGLLYLSGHGPLRPDGTFVCGRLGDDLTVEQGTEAARLTGLAMLASLQGHCGSLDRIGRLVKTMGLVHATAEFTAHPAVINGFSQLMKDVLGDDEGVAARSAFGAVSLPAGWAVEIEAIFQLR
ncbi:MAG: RidA family protein [Planctomycetales bacterium]|nr:RidA family protein [Planctomycetales bacterium]